MWEAGEARRDRERRRRVNTAVVGVKGDLFRVVSAQFAGITAAAAARLAYVPLQEARHISFYLAMS